MMHPTRAGIGLIRLGDSDFVLANPEDDLRTKDVYNADGQRVGSVEDQRRAYVARGLRCRRSGPAREDGVDVKQAFEEAY